MQPLFAQGLHYQLLFLAAYAVWIVPELIGNLVEAVTSAKRVPQEQNDGSSGLVIMIGVTLLPLAAFLIAELFQQTRMFPHGLLVYFAGIVAMLGGVALRWYSVRTLGRFFSRSVAIQEHHEVVAKGPYRLIRHPSYTGTMLTLVGIGLVTDNWLSLLLISAGGFAAYTYRIAREERTLVRALGESYRDYMARTKRFIPFIF